MRLRITTFLLFISFLLTLTFLPTVYAHPGRTDAYGCHTCRTNCANWGLATGEYHCHNAKALPQPEEPIHSKYGENGTGYTYVAPEYASSVDTTPSSTIQVSNYVTDNVPDSSWLNNDSDTDSYVSVFSESADETPQIESEPVQTIQSVEEQDGLIVYQSPYPTIRVGDEVELKIGVKNLGLNKWNTWDNWLDSTANQRIFVNEWQQPADVNQEITGDDTGVFIKKFKSDHPGQFTVHIQPRLWNRNIKLRDSFGNTDIFWLVNVGE